MKTILTLLYLLLPQIASASITLLSTTYRDEFSFDVGDSGANWSPAFHHSGSIQTAAPNFWAQVDPNGATFGTPDPFKYPDGDSFMTHFSIKTPLSLTIESFALDWYMLDSNVFRHLAVTTSTFLATQSHLGLGITADTWFWILNDHEYSLVVRDLTSDTTLQSINLEPLSGQQIEPSGVDRSQWRQKKWLNLALTEGHIYELSIRADHGNYRLAPGMDTLTKITVSLPEKSFGLGAFGMTVVALGIFRSRKSFTVK